MKSLHSVTQYYSVFYIMRWPSATGTLKELVVSGKDIFVSIVNSASKEPKNKRKKEKEELHSTPGLETLPKGKDALPRRKR